MESYQRIPTEGVEAKMLRRPYTLPDLFGGRSVGGAPATEARLKLTKLLLNVTIQGSVGPVQVLMSPESTVGDLIAAAIRQYTKEGRRPVISADPSKFDLHYSQFSLESLNREEKLMALGSRNFFLCAKKSAMDGAIGSSISSSSSCSKEVDNAAVKGGSAWLKFMDLLR